MRVVKVYFDNGDYFTTGINGTQEEIERYYSIGSKWQTPCVLDETYHTIIKLEFIK